MQLAYGLYPDGYLPRMVIVSDGNQTVGDVAVEAGSHVVHDAEIGLARHQDLGEFARAREMPYFILGRGSDLVISDAGMAGLVIFRTESLTHSAQYLGALLGLNGAGAAQYAADLFLHTGLVLALVVGVVAAVVALRGIEALSGKKGEKAKDG
jgi:hypothetical protein